MRYRQLGTSGLTVSVVGLGCNNFGNRCDLEQTLAVVDAALEQGVTLLDTADTYGGGGGSETFLGQILKDRRDRVVLATKFGSPMGGLKEEARGSRRYIRRAVEASLRRLQTDYIDLYQHHRPDPKTPLEETVAALDELVTEGKIRYAGSSNYAGFRIADADWIALQQHRSRLISAQNHYSLLERGVEHEVLPACEAHGVGMLPFYPLANGLLTGKYRRDGATERGRLVGRADWLTGGVRQGRGAGEVRRRARRRPARRGHRRARSPAGGRLGDRRRHPPRAGARQRQGGRVGAEPRRPRRAGRRDPARLLDQALIAAVATSRCESGGP
jgi:aryl-alcohol dehydrogenase-like predicted oxidoreductase